MDDIGFGAIEPRDRLHDEDVELLERVISGAAEDPEAHGGQHHSAFVDMARYLEEHPRAVLTDKQRQYAHNVLGEPVYENLVSSGKVPRGKEVETPDVLKPHNLPKRPPGRR